MWRIVWSFKLMMDEIAETIEGVHDGTIDDVRSPLSSHMSLVPPYFLLSRN